MSQLFLALFFVTFSIFIHELGHFLAARWRKLAVPRFSIFGIGKPIVRRTWRGVEYCICWLPIGAYVMIPQLSDLGDFEGEVPPEAAKLPPADYTSKVLVAVAGPASNIVLALLLACVVWYVGVRVPLEFNRTEIGDVAKKVETSEGKVVAGPAAAAGLQLGDVIRKIDGTPVANFQDVFTAIVFGSQVTPDGRRVATITLERNGTTVTKQVFPELTGTEGLRTIGIGPRSDLVVDKVATDSAAAKAGLLPGDRIMAVDGHMLSRREELRLHFQKKNSTPSILEIKRGDKTLTASLRPAMETVDGQNVYLIGITWRIETVLIHTNPFAQIGEACVQVYQTLASLLNRRSDIGVRHMSGIVGIVDNLQQVASAGLIPAFSFLIAINVSLAIANMLPIPVLDGGHVLIATLTKLRRRPLNPVWMQNAVAVCFFMLIGLIVYVSYHDIRRAIQNHTNDSPTVSTPGKRAEPPPKTEPAKP
jgi:regulator of sigma E protease